MNDDIVDRLRAWFAAYTHSFLKGSADTDSPLLLKIDHTQRVCRNIVTLAEAVGLEAKATRLAEIVALFHDVGRFDQYHRYGTFNDRASANHARMGVAVLKNSGVLEALDAKQQAIILDAVGLHNAPCLPRDRPADAMIFLRLIRDADKLDIWRVFARTFGRRETTHPAVIQDLPDTPTWSEAILGAIGDRRMARLKDMKSLNDFKLLQLSWVFDLQFNETCQEALVRGDLGVIARTLPKEDAVHRAILRVMDELDRRAVMAAR